MFVYQISSANQSLTWLVANSTFLPDFTLTPSPLTFEPIMPRPSTSIADFTTLPVLLPSKTLSSPNPIPHYIYLKPYDPKLPDEESPRSLFLVNIPVTTTETQLRHLLTTQLGGGHVQTVYFAGGDAESGNGNALIATTRSGSGSGGKGGKEVASTLGKRKRSAKQSASEINESLKGYTLPATAPSQLHVSGSSAIVVFLDRPARDMTMKAVRKAAKSSKQLIWCAGLDASKMPLMGVHRYAAQKQLTYPPRADLLRLVDKYMTTYSDLEEAKARETRKQMAEPDEDGFVTVTRGTKGVVKRDEADEVARKLQEKRKKEVPLEDFYRFQHRERRREQGEGLRRRFEEERRRVADMRSGRGG